MHLQWCSSHSPDTFPSRFQPPPVVSSLPQFGWHWSKGGKGELFPRQKQRQIHGSSNSFPPKNDTSHLHRRQIVLGPSLAPKPRP